MYKKLLIIIILIVTFTMIGGCSNQEKLKVIVPNGTPLIAIAGVEDVDVIVENVSGPSLLIATMTSNTHDIIIAPIISGIELYNKKSSVYKLDSIITFSNLYIVSKEQLKSINDLNGKKIVSFGQNTLPGLIMEKALEDIDYEAIYVSSVSDAVGYLVNDTDEYDYILTSEPTLSTLIHKKNISLNIIDLSLIVKDHVPLIPQAGIFINPNSKNKDKIQEYVKSIKANIEYLNNNPKDYSEKVVALNDWLLQMGASIIEKSIPKSNIDFKKAKDEKENLEIFYKFLQENSNLLTGVPDDEFYN